jgi:hypothetical protein
MIDHSIFSIHRWDTDAHAEITEAYGAECPHCAQVVHVPGVEEARAALNLHLAAGTDTRCAYWPDTGAVLVSKDVR